LGGIFGSSVEPTLLPGTQVTDSHALRGKSVLVTGGSMGIGFAAAEACLRAGASVGICARTASTVDDAVRDLRAKGLDDIMGSTCDVTEASDLESTFDAVESRMGPLSGVIHAAGVYGPIGPITEVDPESWFDALRINLLGSFLIIRQASPRLAENGGGRIVLFAGGGAATPFPNYTAYACGKAGVVRLTETAALELAGARVEVNCIAPGFVVTRLHQETLAAGERAGSAFLEMTKQQIEKGGVAASVGAQAAVFLVSDAAKGITGRFLAAPYDDYMQWPQHLEELADSDLFALRRIVPRDRGMDWQ